MSDSMKGRVNDGVDGEDYTDHSREIGSEAGNASSGFSI